MSNDGANNDKANLANAGGARCALDPANEKDRGMLRRIMQQYPRWSMPEDDKPEYLQGLREANRVARAHLTDPDKSLDAAKTVGSIVKTRAMIEAQNQRDDHQYMEWERLDAGLATARVDHTETSAALANPDAIRAAIEYDRAMRKPVANTAPAHLNGHLNGHANGHQNGTSNGSANGHAPHP